HSEIRLLVRTALESEGYRVTDAGDVAEAMVRLANEIPDLILSDIMMPDVDGFGFVQRLRSDRRLLGVPVIFLTASPDESIEQRARALGVEHFIAKPFTTARLLGTVRGTLERFTQLRDAGVVRASVPTVAAAPDVVATGIGPLDEMLGGL